MMLSPSFLHYATADADSIPAERRLREALVATTGSPVKAQLLSDLVVTCFEGTAFELARFWRQGTAPDDWWEVRFTQDAAGIAEFIDLQCVGDSLVRSVAFSLDALRAAKVASRLTLNRVGDVFVVASDGVCLTRISPVVFHDVDDAHSDRVMRSLEGLRKYGEANRVVQRLADIPGLQKLMNRQVGGLHHTEACGAAFLPNSRSLAKVLRLNLADLLGLHISQGQSQECLATMLGFMSWNEMAAREANCAGVYYPITVFASDESGEQLWHRHYRSQGAALWAFGQALREDRRGLTPGLFGTFNNVAMVVAGHPSTNALSEMLLGCGAWYAANEFGDETMDEAAELLEASGVMMKHRSGDKSEARHGES